MHALTAEWVDRAEHDFGTAHRVLETGAQPYPEVACFHCQQTAEKYLKAYLEEHRVRFPFTHLLIDHLELCRSVDPEFEILDADLRELDGYAVRVRYPGVEVTLEMAQDALAAATCVRAFVRGKLGLI